MDEQLLNRIKQNAGEVFYTIKKLPFTYAIQKNAIITDRTDYPIPLSEISKAAECMPCAGPGAIGKIVRGSSYVWAILNDPRIQGKSPQNKKITESKRKEKPLAKAMSNVATGKPNTLSLENYEQRFQQLKSIMDGRVAVAIDEAIRIAHAGSDAALIPLAKTLEGNRGLLNSLCKDNTRCHLSWGREQEADKLFKAVQFVSPILPSYVITALQNFVRLRNDAAHETATQAEMQKKASDGLEAYLQFVEWYYTHYKSATVSNKWK